MQRVTCSGWRAASLATAAVAVGLAGLAGPLAVAAAHAPDAGDADAVSLPPAQRYSSAWDVLCQHPEHGRFAELAASVGLHHVLDGDHELTVFAPVNAAFDALPAGELERLQTPKGKADLTALLRGHLMWGAVEGHDLSGVLMRPTLANFAVIIEPAAHAHDDGHAHGDHCDHDAEAVLVVAERAAVALDAEAVTGPIYQIDGLIVGEAASTSWRHAPACDGEPGHGAGGHGGGGSGAHAGGHHAGHSGHGNGSAGPGQRSRPGGGSSPGIQPRVEVGGGAGGGQTGGSGGNTFDGGGGDDDGGGCGCGPS